MELEHAFQQSGFVVALQLLIAGSLLAPGEAVWKYAVSLIMLPSGGETPSELTKAAAILQDEPERFHTPIQLMQTAEA